MIKTIIFDFGDTLVIDTNRSFRDKYGFKHWPKKTQKAYTWAFYKSATAKFSGLVLWQQLHSILPQFSTKLIRQHMEHTKPLPTARLLDKLKKNYQIIIFSDNQRGLPQVQKKNLKHNYFKGIPFVNSANVGMRKPHPDFYQYLIRRFRLNPKECLFVDNMQMNLTPAKKLGIITYRYDQDFPKLVRFLKKTGIQI